MNRATFLLPAITLSLPLLGGFYPQQSSPRIAQATPIRDGWGLALEAGQPFYQVGDVLDASFSVTNFTHQDTFGFGLVRGGNGCTYRFTIEDIAGDVVWQPGSIFNGVFTGPGCSFAVNFWDFSAGTQQKRENAIPLIFHIDFGVREMIRLFDQAILEAGNDHLFPCFRPADCQ